ncbi:MFS transporter [Pseudonocardia sulfidoxydans NBRC 16205]|uniref:MFS transporter n=1 Tax=Pseudonocardia sulfidoxydans NBRC 16205 TaxID=1223511 RepID=A0A511D9W9_9PSEU|nr:MFS transporter [Pseudonocardia sulfidoxydans]GEL21615.1 MFS transporter [Pseudonocardia sulfidoxydans NBRC 16205]
MSTDTAAAPRTASNTRRANFASAWLGWMLDGFETYAIVLVGSLVVADLVGTGASPVYFGTILAVQLIAWAVGGLASGVLIDYFGRRKVLMASILTYAIATGLAALSPNFAIFLVLRIIAGLGMGAEWGPGSALVAETWSDRSRGKGIALLQCAFGVGFLVATGVFWLLGPTEPGTWRWLLAIGALPALVVLFVRRRVGESPMWEDADARRRAATARAAKGETLDEHERALTVFTLRRLFTEPTSRSRLLKLLACSTASLVGWWAVSTWVPQYAGAAVKAAGAAPTTTTLIVLAYNVGGVLGWLAWGVLADAIGRRWALWSYFAGALVLTWVLFGIEYSSLGLLTLVVAVNGFFTLGQMGWMATYPGELFPTSLRGSAITVVFNVSRVFAAAGALLAGAIVGGLGGIATAALVIGSIYVLGLVFALIAGPETKGKPLPE